MRATLTAVAETGAHDVIAALFGVATSREALAQPAGLAEALATLLEICRPRSEIAEECAMESSANELKNRPRPAKNRHPRPVPTLGKP